MTGFGLSKDDLAKMRAIKEQHQEHAGHKEHDTHQVSSGVLEQNAETVLVSPKTCTTGIKHYPDGDTPLCKDYDTNGDWRELPIGTTPNKRWCERCRSEYGRSVATDGE